MDAPPEAEDPAGDRVEVWDDLWNAFAIFRACATQWRVVATPHALVHCGLDYPAVEVVMRRLLPAGADAGAVFADVMAMEAAALPILNEAPV